VGVSVAVGVDVRVVVAVGEGSGVEEGVIVSVGVSEGVIVVVLVGVSVSLSSVGVTVEGSAVIVGVFVGLAGRVSVAPIVGGGFVGSAVVSVLEIGLGGT
jgi:hypothetical protein